jgi:hypothetical protein
MKALIAIGFGAFFVSSLAIGLRLVWLAYRNRELPELLIGLGILGIGPAGFAGMIFALMLGTRHPSAAAGVLAAATLAISGGSLAAGLAAAVLRWIAFLPPRAYRRWIRGLVPA